MGSPQTVPTASAREEGPMNVELTGDTLSPNMAYISPRNLSTAIHDILSLITGNGPTVDHMNSEIDSKSFAKFQKCFCLFSHGSYNPPHNDHIQMLISAREMILSKNQDALVIGFLGHTSQNWMKHGKRLPPSDRFSDEHRRNMLILAMSDLPWLYYAEDGPKFHSSRGLKTKYVMEIQEEIKRQKERSNDKTAFNEVTFFGVDVFGSDTRYSRCCEDDCIVIIRENTSIELCKEKFLKRKESKSSDKRKFPVKEDQLQVGKLEVSNKIVNMNVYIEEKYESHENLEISVCSEISQKFEPHINFDYKNNLIYNATMGHSSTLVRKALKVLNNPKTYEQKAHADEYLKFALHPKVRKYINEIGDNIIDAPL